MAAVDILQQLAPAQPPQPATAAPRPEPLPASRSPGPWISRSFLIAWCGFLFFYGLNVGQLWKTEGLRAIVAAEYLRTGNWIVPNLYGEPLFTKPPGMYVAIALFSLPFGQVTEWTARLPSAIAATLTVLMLYGYFARLFGRRGGMLVALLAPMVPLWLDKGTAAEIDMMQVMWVTASILCLLRILEYEDDRRSLSKSKKPDNPQVRVGTWTVDGDSVQGEWSPADPSPNNSLAPHPSSLIPHPSPFPWWLLALLCVAGGVLTKWTAPAFFYATAVPLLFWRGQLRLLWSWRHLVAAAVGATVCFAWIGAAVAMAGWGAFYETVSREALQRMVPSLAPKTDPWYVFASFPVVLWYNNLPWSLVALLACRPSFGRLWDARGRLLWQALHCWIWPNVLIWSLMLDHKARHSFPLFPAFAGLAAMVWLAWLSGRLPWRWRIQPRRILIAAAVCWLVTKFVFVHHHMAQRFLIRDPQGKAAILASLVPSECILYLFHLKDEGIMFYYGRTARRLHSPAELPSSAEPLYCILAKGELEAWPQSSTRTAVPLTGTELKDEQGDPMVLVRVQ